MKLLKPTSRKIFGCSFGLLIMTIIFLDPGEFWILLMFSFFTCLATIFWWVVKFTISILDPPEGTQTTPAGVCKLSVSGALRILNKRGLSAIRYQDINFSKKPDRLLKSAILTLSSQGYVIKDAE